MTVPWAMVTRGNFGFSGAKTSTSLKKSRTVRAMELTSNHQNQEFATDNEKSQDPAKMTHPIPDFLSRDGATAVRDDPQS